MAHVLTYDLGHDHGPLARVRKAFATTGSTGRRWPSLPR